MSNDELKRMAAELKAFSAELERNLLKRTLSFYVAVRALPDEESHEEAKTPEALQDPKRLQDSGPQGAAPPDVAMPDLPALGDAPS